MSTPLTPELVETHGRFVRELARALLADPHAADDLAQDAWAQWLRRGPAHLDSPRGWLARAVRHLASNQRRALVRRARHEALGAETESARSPADEVAQRELLHRVVEAVYALDEPYRETILARHFRGLSAGELAAESATPLATVRSREQRALAMLRERLDREHGGRAAWALLLARAAGLATSAGGTLTLLQLAGGLALVVGASWFGWRALATERAPSPLAGASEELASVETPSALATTAAAGAQGNARAEREPSAVELSQVQVSATEAAPLVGTTVDLEGRPLAGVRVSFHRVAQERPLAVAESDASGAFRVEALALVHTVDAELAGYRFLHATDPAGDGLEPWRPMRITLAPASRLCVRVHDTVGEALAGVSVSVQPRPEEQHDSWPSGMLASPGVVVEGETDSHGVVELAGVWTDVRLALALDVDPGAIADSGEAHTDRQRDGRLVLDDAPGAPIVLRAGQGLELEARWDVELALRGLVLDATGQPASDADVELTDESRARYAEGWLLGRARTDARGQFELAWRAAAPRGPFVVRATASGAPHEVGRDERGGPASTLWVPASVVQRELSADELRAGEPLELVLAPNGLDVLTGFLDDAHGEPVAKWNEHELALLAHGSSLRRGPDSIQTYSNGGGFLFAGLAPGLYDVVHAPRSPRPGEPVFTVFSRLAAGGEDLRLRLPEHAGVRLRLRGEALQSLALARFFPTDAAAFSRPTAPTTLALTERAFWLAAQDGGDLDVLERADGMWLVVHAEPDGAREVELELGEPGWYCLGAAGAPPAAPVASALLYFDAGEHVVDVQPPEATGVLHGRLLADGAREFYGLVLADERGQPFAIEGPSLDAARLRVLPVKASGEFQLRELALGRYRLRAGTVSELERGRFAREVELEVVAGENPPLEIRL